MEDNVMSAGELGKFCERFNKIYGLASEINYTFKERFQKILDDNPQITAAKFFDKTGHDINRFYRMRRGEPTSMVTFITFCIAFEIDIQNTIEMLKSLGVVFNPTNKTHAAYCYLISECRGNSIYKCNEILKKLGITELLGEE